MNQATTKSGMATKQSQFKNVVRGFSLVLHDQRVALQKLIMPGNDKAFKNVVAQFIGQLCLMNQATTKFGMATKQSQFKNVVRGFSLVHDQRVALQNLEANS